jgi:hypothetical protein
LATGGEILRLKWKGFLEMFFFSAEVGARKRNITQGDRRFKTGVSSKARNKKHKARMWRRDPMSRRAPERRAGEQVKKRKKKDENWSKGKWRLKWQSRMEGFTHVSIRSIT